MRVSAVDLITQIKCHLESLTLLGTSILHILVHVGFVQEFYNFPALVASISIMHITVSVRKYK